MRRTCGFQRTVPIDILRYKAVEQFLPSGFFCFLYSVFCPVQYSVLFVVLLLFCFLKLQKESIVTFLVPTDCYFFAYSFGCL